MSGHNMLGLDVLGDDALTVLAARVDAIEQLISAMQGEIRQILRSRQPRRPAGRSRVLVGAIVSALGPGRAFELLGEEIWNA